MKTRSLILMLMAACTLDVATTKQKPMLLANYYVWYHTGEHKIASMCYPLEGSQ